MPLRTEVEKALDDLIAEEENFKFQGLGVVLAKQKWPRLIASEGRYDLASMSARMPATDRCHDRQRPAGRRYNAGAARRLPSDSCFPTKTAHPGDSSPEDPP